MVRLIPDFYFIYKFLFLKMEFKACCLILCTALPAHESGAYATVYSSKNKQLLSGGKKGEISKWRVLSAE